MAVADLLPAESAPAGFTAWLEAASAGIDANTAENVVLGLAVSNLDTVVAAQTSVLVLAAADPIPGGTAPGTVIVRTA